MLEANKTLATQWFEDVWNKKSEAAIDQLFSLESKCYGFPDSESSIGREEFKATYRNFCGAFPDLQVVIDDIIAEEDRVAIRWKATMTHSGDHLGFTATNKQVTLHGSSFITVANGQIANGWNYMDMGALFQKLQEPPA